MVRLPSLNGLRAFEAAARHLSFTLAAAELNVTQTAISHLIRRLEDELGVRLFVRQNRALTLTPQGIAYLPGVRAAFQDLRLATEQLIGDDDGKVLTISTLTSLAAKWLLPRLPDFQSAHPDIDVRITTTTNLVDFGKDNVDAAIRYGRGQWPGLRADWLMAEELFPVCSPALMKGDRPLRQPKDVADHTLLHTSGYIEDWRLWLTAAGLPSEIMSNPGLTFDYSFLTVQAAIDGLGIAMGRTAFVETDIARGRLVVPFRITLPSDAGFYLVCPANAADKPKIAVFRKWLIESARQTAYSPMQDDRDVEPSAVSRARKAIARAGATKAGAAPPRTARKT